MLFNSRVKFTAVSIKQCSTLLLNIKQNFSKIYYKITSYSYNCLSILFLQYYFQISIFNIKIRSTDIFKEEFIFVIPLIGNKFLSGIWRNSAPCHIVACRTRFGFARNVRVQSDAVALYSYNILEANYCRIITYTLRPRRNFQRNNKQPEKKICRPNYNIIKINNLSEFHC